MALDFNGSTQYLSISSGFGLAANDSVWLALRVRADTIPDSHIIDLGVAGSGNNRKTICISSTQFTVFTVDNAGTLVAAQTGTGVSTGQWYGLVAELGGGAFDKAITVNGGTRHLNNIGNSLTVAPDVFRVGISAGLGAPFDGQIAYIGLWQGVPNADQRAAAWQIHPLKVPVGTSTLIDAWDLSRSSSIVGYKGNVLSATASPSLVDSPRILLPFGRSRVVVPATGGAALECGVASGSATGNTTAALSVGAASGGTAPYSYQWYRDTTPGFTPSGANDVVGATSTTLNDTGLTPSTTYYYKVRVTDDVAATDDSNEVSITTSALSTRVNRVTFFM